MGLCIDFHSIIALIVYSLKGNTKYIQDFNGESVWKAVAWKTEERENSITLDLGDTGR
jgi:hypothetical protein